MKHSKLMVIEDYREILAFFIENCRQGSGYKTKLAEASQMKSSYLSKILSGGADLSLDQAYLLCQFWGLDRMEEEYFIATVIIARTNSRPLKNIYLDRLKSLRREYFLRPLNGFSTLDSDQTDMIELLSEWYVPIILTALQMPELRSSRAIARKISLVPDKVERALKVMQKHDLVEYRNEEWQLKELQHLDPNVIKGRLTSHAALLNKAITVSSTGGGDGLHESMVCTFSKIDFEKIKQTIKDFLQFSVNSASKSNAEEILVIGVDFFRFGEF